MRQRIHTGCHCQRCASGKDKVIRQYFHRKLRKIHKQQLKKSNDITDINISIGWTG